MFFIFKYCSRRVFGFMCVGTQSPQINTTPSGKFSTLACGHSLLIPISSPSHTLQHLPIGSHIRLCSTITSIAFQVLSPGSTLPDVSCPIHSLPWYFHTHASFTPQGWESL
jgi:hypothetical protein